MGIIEGIMGLFGATIAGLGGITVVIVAVLLLWLLVKLFSLPLKLVWNGVIGALMLWVVNLVGGYFGFAIHINVIKALIAGFFGIPGAAAVILYEVFGK